MAQSIDGRYWEREEETRREQNSQPSEKKPDKSSNQQSSSNNSKKDSKNNAKRISLQIKEAHRVTPRRRTPISPINSAKTESSHKPSVHADSIIISAYFVEVWDTLPKNVLNPLLQRRKLRLVQRRLSLTVHLSLKTQKSLSSLL